MEYLNSTEQLIQMTLEWQRTARHSLKTFEITYPNFRVLRALKYDGNKLSQKELAEVLQMDSMSLSTMLRNLERMRLIIRNESISDTRKKIIQLTPLGYERISLAEQFLEHEAKLFFESFNIFGLQLIDILNKTY